MSDRTFPPCPPEVCRKAQSKINEYCKNMGWPPDHPIIMYNDGSLCYCTCGGVSEKSKGNATKKPAGG
jgi:hypothetical protein